MAFDAGICGTTSGSLSALPSASCVNTLDQTQKIALQITQNTPSFKVASTGTGSYALQATWTPLLSASDATKVLITPYIENLVIPNNEVIEEANENNINGLPQHGGMGYVTVTGRIKNADPAVIKSLKDQFESRTGQTAGVTTVWAYLLGRNSRVTGTSSDGTNLAGIPIYNLTISDVGGEGIRKANYHNIRFILAENWSEYLKTLVASFNPVSLT